MSVLFRATSASFPPGAADAADDGAADDGALLVVGAAEGAVDAATGAVDPAGALVAGASVPQAMRMLAIADDERPSAAARAMKSRRLRRPEMSPSASGRTESCSIMLLLLLRLTSV